MSSNLAALGTALLLATVPACARDAPALRLSSQSMHAPQRTIPPPSLACPRNQLTSYDGRVFDYGRKTSGLRLRIHTEWDSEESVALALTGPALIAQLRIDGRAFSEDDWARIESAPGELRDGVDVIAWVCEDPRILPVVDWRPAFSPAR